MLRVNGRVPRDVIEWRLWSDEADVGLEIDRSGLELELDVHKRAGQPLGAEVSSAVFDRVRTCDNHCEFCFIYQLPKGLRRSLYLKDDDYRLSFLYGNFTTLTRFTEADLERVVTEGLSPLHVSIHATDPALRAADAAQPARRDQPALAAGAARPRHRGPRPARRVPRRQRRRALDDTLAGILDEYPELTSVAVVPLGISRFNPEADMRPHTPAEAAARRRRRRGLAGRLPAALGRRLVHAADEYYLMADRPFPAAEPYEGFAMHEDGIGMARTFELEFTRADRRRHRPAARLLRRRRRRAGRRRLRARCRRTRPPTPGCAAGGRRAPVDAAAAAGGAGRHPVRRARRARAGARWSTASVATTSASSRSPTSSSAATPASPG